MNQRPSQGIEYRRIAINPAMKPETKNMSPSKIEMQMDTGVSGGGIIAT